MKTYLKNIIGGAALGMTLLANSVPTWAGLASRNEVFVGPYYASGAMPATRYSLDNRQNISCQVNKTASSLYLSCFAQDKNGASYSCLSYDPKLIELTHTITDYSYIYFQTPSGSSTCNYLHVNNSSFLLR